MSQDARVATFFAAYPDLIDLPDGSYFSVALASPIRGFTDRIAIHLKHGEPPIWLNPQLANSLMVSVRFHRLKLRRNKLAQAYTNVMPVVRSVGGPSFPHIEQEPSEDTLIEDNLGDNADEQISTSTVVEMSTQLVVPRENFWEASDPESDIMGPTLTRCIEAMILVVNAYRFAQKTMIPAPARERLGPIIIAATRPANPTNGPWDDTVHDVFNAFAGYLGATLPDLEAGDPLQRMARVVFLQQIDHPVLPLMELQYDTNSAFHLEGNFRATVIFAHAASEVLMDTALLSMLYEEGKSPAEAISAFDRPLKRRVLDDFHERLGGTWNDQEDKPVGRWLRDLLQIRHRVAHAGYRPTYDEARLARDAHLSLGSHLRDRLVQKVKRYPLTAGMLVTPGGFDRRGVHTKAAAEAIRLAESAALGNFLTWRTETLSLRR
jgi:hypothetical protein